MYMEKMEGDSKAPCLTPEEHSKKLESMWRQRTQDWTLLYIAFIMDENFVDRCKSLKTRVIKYIVTYTYLHNTT